MSPPFIAPGIPNLYALEEEVVTLARMGADLMRLEHVLSSNFLPADLGLSTSAAPAGWDVPRPSVRWEGETDGQEVRMSPEIQLTDPGQRLATLGPTGFPEGTSRRPSLAAPQAENREDSTDSRGPGWPRLERTMPEGGIHPEAAQPGSTGRSERDVVQDDALPGRAGEPLESGLIRRKTTGGTGPQPSADPAEPLVHGRVHGPSPAGTIPPPKAAGPVVKGLKDFAQSIDSGVPEVWLSNLETPPLPPTPNSFLDTKEVGAALGAFHSPPSSRAFERQSADKEPAQQQAIPPQRESAPRSVSPEEPLYDAPEAPGALSLYDVDQPLERPEEFPSTHEIDRVMEALTEHLVREYRRYYGS